MISSLLHFAGFAKTSRPNALRPPTKARNAEAAAKLLAHWRELLTNLPSKLPHLLNAFMDKAAIQRATLTPLDLIPMREALATADLSNMGEIRAVFEHALDATVTNLPTLMGRTFLALDSSGSMMGSPLRVGALLAASLLRAGDSSLVLFDTEVRKVSLDTTDFLNENCADLETKARMTPTNFSCLFTAVPRNADKIIVITDVPFCLQEYSTRLAWERCRQRSLTTPELWIVDVTGRGPNISNATTGVTICNGVTPALLEALATPLVTTTVELSKAI